VSTNNTITPSTTGGSNDHETNRQQAADISILARRKGGSTHTNRSTSTNYNNVTIDKRASATILGILEYNSQPQSGFVFSTPTLFVEGGWPSLAQLHTHTHTRAHYIQRSSWQADCLGVYTKIIANPFSV
jgi:hypothetical protein